MHPAPHQRPPPRKIVEALDEVANVLLEGRLLSREYASLAAQYEQKAGWLEQRLDAARAILSAAGRAA